MSRPKNADSARVQEALIDHALRLMEEVGPGAVSLRKVAERAGVAMGTAQYYFETKEKLFEAALDRPFREAFEIANEVVALIVAKAPRDAIIRTAVSRGFRVTLKWRAAFRFNLLLVIERGIMHSRRSAEEDGLFEKAGEIAGEVLELPVRDARLLLKSIIFTTMRYALSADDELRRFVGAPHDEPIERVLDIVERHLVTLACSYVAPNG